MRSYEDLTGMTFGKLHVLYREGKGQSAKWVCNCDCGNIAKVTTGNLKHGNVRSCGCLARELSSQRATTHGDTHTRLYRIWGGMRRRCYEEQNKDYPRYGGRGISVCDEWADYQSFKDWSINNGYNDYLTIDRIDVNGPYCPDNCRWIDTKAQNNNRRSNRMIDYNGESMTLSQWSERTGIPPKTLRYRLEAGWEIADALAIPVSHNNRLVKHF